MENLLRKENLKKGVIVSLVVLVMLSNAISLIFDSDSGMWGNKLKDNIAYTTSSGGYCKVTAQGGKVGFKFPYVEAEMLSLYFYKVQEISCSYSYVKNGETISKHVLWTGSTGKKVLKIDLPVGTTSFSFENCEATFEFNPVLLPAAGLWGWFFPRYVCQTY